MSLFSKERLVMVLHRPGDTRQRIMPSLTEVRYFVGMLKFQGVIFLKMEIDKPIPSTPTKFILRVT